MFCVCVCVHAHVCVFMHVLVLSVSLCFCASGAFSLLSWFCFGFLFCLTFACLFPKEKEKGVERGGVENLEGDGREKGLEEDVWMLTYSLNMQTQSKHTHTHTCTQA